MSVNGSPLAAVPLSVAKLAATIKCKGPRSKLERPELLVELNASDGCVALSEPETLKGIACDPELRASAILHLESLQAEITMVMKSLQQAS